MELMNEHCQTVYGEQVNQENAAELPEKEVVDTELTEMEEVDTEMPETEDTSKIQGSALVDELLSKTPKRNYSLISSRFLGCSTSGHAENNDVFLTDNFIKIEVRGVVNITIFFLLFVAKGTDFRPIRQL